MRQGGRRMKRGDCQRQRILAPGATGRARILAPGVTGRAEMLHVATSATKSVFYWQNWYT